MHYTPQTPFRRADRARLPEGQRAPSPLPIDAGDSVDKWQVLRDLAAVRQTFGLSDRDLTVLTALVSFHPAKVLKLGGDLIVHPSNETICTRLNGMACSTMRRHLARLVESGLILRRDSPNGKRYARRSTAGKVAFGFDLSPLIYSAVQLADMARDALTEAEALYALRERVSLLRRDVKTCAQAGDVSPALRLRLCTLADECARALRRKRDRDALEHWDSALTAALCDLEDEMRHAADLSTNAAENEQHHKKPNSDILSSEKVFAVLDAGQHSLTVSLRPDSLSQNAEKDEVTHSADQSAISETVGVKAVQPLPQTLEISARQQPTAGVGTDFTQPSPGPDRNHVISPLHDKVHSCELRPNPPCLDAAPAHGLQLRGNLRIGRHSQGANPCPNFLPAVSTVCLAPWAMERGAILRGSPVWAASHWTASSAAMPRTA